MWLTAESDSFLYNLQFFLLDLFFASAALFCMLLTQNTCWQNNNNLLQTFFFMLLSVFSWCCVFQWLHHLQHDDFMNHSWLYSSVVVLLRLQPQSCCLLQFHCYLLWFSCCGLLQSTAFKNSEFSLAFFCYKLFTAYLQISFLQILMYFYNSSFVMNNLLTECLSQCWERSSIYHDA